MELDFLVSCSDKVVDDVGGRGVASGAAEPFLASQTSDNAAGVVDAAVSSFVSLFLFRGSVQRTRKHEGAAPSLPLV